MTGKGEVVTKEVLPKSDCLSYISARNEDEIILRSNRFDIRSLDEFHENVNNLLGSIEKPKQYYEILLGYSWKERYNKYKSGELIVDPETRNWFEEASKAGFFEDE